MNVDSATGRLSLPPERFYWAVIDLKPLGRQTTEQALGSLFENVLPLPIEDIQPAYLRCDSTYMIACGMKRFDLSALLAECGTAPTSLGPESIPHCVEGEIRPGSLNLLTGPFEPIALRTMRHRSFLAMLALIGIAAMLLMLGLQRRIYALNAQAQARQTDIQAICKHVLQGSSSTANPSQPLRLRVTAELRQLRQTRSRPDDQMQPVDCSDSLVNLLTRWPSQLHLQIEGVSVSASLITLRGAAPSSADVQVLADAIGNLDGWRMQQPQINVHGNAVQAGWRWQRPENVNP